ncbi:conserved hypothetical protein [Roseibium sp. TrichSKD4]|uniref:hypothetical protein n=1 Tax=Roseibium sp. TrichSKD4 TaxID=744980 RepID=UPI0001E56DC2|nr:hypothetical protein [Roseibium sp. TrichSKD4]EFO30288.1 conserved hypothetical protein [Roseibium sp. TrichSKD4]
MIVLQKIAKRVRFFATFVAGMAIGLGSSWAAEAYDLLFKTGTLDNLPRSQQLTYDRQVALPSNQELADHSTGTVRLSFGEDDMADLRFEQGEKYRKIGAFPATVGNPMIMYFVETVIRDMAGTAGGSPFYIRNRVKASLIEKTPINDTEITVDNEMVPAKTVTLYPFKNDPNRERMKGFEDLALTVTMSEAVPGWYYALEADTGNSVYTSSIVLSENGGTE